VWNRVASGARVKVATWNVNSLRVRLGHVIAWLQREQPDVLALQETKLKNEDFPLRELEALGYRAAFNGQPSYNGVAVLARGAIETGALEIPSFADPQKRVLVARVAGLTLWNLYVPNGQTVDSDQYRYKLAWLDALRSALERELDGESRLLVVGDFNIAPEDRDVHDPIAWQGHVMVSAAEREAYGELVKLGLADLYRRFEQPERGYSWWDYRAGSFRRDRGLRIDLMLGSQALAEACASVRIDKEPRGWERPSDHVPVIAEFV
jgi:exodeoxyribonuclease III